LSYQTEAQHATIYSVTSFVLIFLHCNTWEQFCLVDMDTNS